MFLGAFACIEIEQSIAKFLPQELPFSRPSLGLPIGRIILGAMQFRHPCTISNLRFQSTFLTLEHTTLCQASGNALAKQIHPKPLYIIYSCLWETQQITIMTCETCIHISCRNQPAAKDLITISVPCRFQPLQQDLRLVRITAFPSLQLQHVKSILYKYPDAPMTSKSEESDFRECPEF